jgi:hypothetical protein
MKPVRGFLLQVCQGKEITGPVELGSWRRALEPESYYVVFVDADKAHIEGGPYDTEERALADISAITDTSGT